jgi:N utilization substance protein B
VSARSKARKRAVDVLFEADQRPGTNVLELLAARLRQSGTQTPLPEYSIEIVEGVAEHNERIDEVLGTYAQGWTLARMPAVDRAILRVGAWELLYNDEVPDAVAVDEAIELARALSTDDSPQFVNGLLGRLLTLKPALLD